MAKKATTGGPTRRKRTPDQEERRTYLSRAEREARVQRWILLGMGGALAVILIILVAGIVWDGVLYPNQPVAIVNGEAITTADFQARVRFTRWQSGIELMNIAQLYGAQALQDTNSPFYNQYAQLQSGREYIIGDQVLNQMVEGTLIRQEAESRGLSVDEAQVDERVQAFFGYDPVPETATPTLEPSVTPTPIVSPTPSPSPTETPEPEETPLPTATPLATSTPQPTLTAAELAERFETRKSGYFAEGADISGYSQEDIREIFRMQALIEQMFEEKLGKEKAEEMKKRMMPTIEKMYDKAVDTDRGEHKFEEITGDMPRIEEQVDVRHILLESEAEAADVMAALAEGEAFAELARYASLDSGNASSGGELGWNGYDAFVAEFADAAFNGEVGAIIGPVQSQFGYHIIQVHAREERELTESEYQQKRQTAFDDWVSNLRAEATTNIEIMPEYAQRIPADPTAVDLGLAVPSGAGQ